MPKCKKCDYYDIDPGAFNFGLCNRCYEQVLPLIHEVVTGFICDWDEEKKG